MHEQKERDRREEPQAFRTYYPTPRPRSELPIRATQPHQAGPPVQPPIGPVPQPHQNFPGVPSTPIREPWMPYSQEPQAHHILSPPVSPTTQPLAPPPRLRSSRSRSPARSPPIKTERPTRTPSPLLSDGEIASSSQSPTPRAPFPPGPNYILYNAPLPDPAPPALFLALERICTVAARNYYASQCQSVLDLPAAETRRYRCRVRFPTVPYRYECNGILDGAGWGAGPLLMEYLARICSWVWARARAGGTHAGELEAVLRMGNLYAWGERVVGAARGEGGGDVYAVVMAGRDLCGWCLCEEGKREIDGLWEGGWGGCEGRGIGGGRG